MIASSPSAGLIQQSCCCLSVTSQLFIAAERLPSSGFASLTALGAPDSCLACKQDHSCCIGSWTENRSGFICLQAASTDNCWARDLHVATYKLYLMTVASLAGHATASPAQMILQRPCWSLSRKGKSKVDAVQRSQQEPPETAAWSYDYRP